MCVCVCVWQADMMFRSGVFWMGLVFIPITSLVFDVAYKVWVFAALSSLIITLVHTRQRKFPPNLSFLLLCGLPKGWLTSARSRCRVSGAICEATSLISWCSKNSLNHRMRCFTVFKVCIMLKHLFISRVKRVCFKTLVDEVQELEALSKDPGAVVHGKRYRYLNHFTICVYISFRFTFWPVLRTNGPKNLFSIKKIPHSD